MSAEWSDAYVLAVAGQLARDFGPSRPDLLEKNPSLPFTELDELLERARALGATIEGGMPEETTAPPETAPVVAALRPIVDRIRAAGAQHFDPIERYDFYVTCTTAWPLVHMQVPEPGGPEMGELELLNLGDTPPAHPAWISRARAIEHPRPRVLYLYGDGIESATGIALGRLPAHAAARSPGVPGAPHAEADDESDPHAAGSVVARAPALSGDLVHRDHARCSGRRPHTAAGLSGGGRASRRLRPCPAKASASRPSPGFPAAQTLGVTLGTRPARAPAALTADTPHDQIGGAVPRAS